MSIQEITDAADVGFGSFYNHFQSKQDLFDAAVEEVLEEHGAMLDAVTARIADPAEVFATAVRMTARLPKTQPQIAKIFRRIGFDLLTAPHGLAPRARRDLQTGPAAGRFTVDDVDVALACAAGALLGYCIWHPHARPAASTGHRTSWRSTCCACSAFRPTRPPGSPAPASRDPPSAEAGRGRDGTGPVRHGRRRTDRRRGLAVQLVAAAGNARPPCLPDDRACPENGRRRALAVQLDRGGGPGIGEAKACRALSVPATRVPTESDSAISADELLTTLSGATDDVIRKAREIRIASDRAVR